jgi:hypothetical protein
MTRNEPARPFLKREEIRHLKKQVATTGSAEAAERLLVDSTRKGHVKLALHRYALLYRLDSQQCAPFEPYCQTVAARMSATELRRVFEHVDRVTRSGANLGDSLDQEQHEGRPNEY